MSIWAVFAVLLGITGFYVFLALYLIVYLVGRTFHTPRGKGRPSGELPRLDALFARLGQRG